MFLKALEMENFKSFRGEVVIPLDRGFSAITGPNGSGKSNCGDAIQFVLGPKSTRTIRAQNTKQLIFNGAEGYKPARGCTVTLVFGNPVLSNGRRRLPIESDEVRMTRSIRLTASDNVVSSYLLDGDESSQKNGPVGPIGPSWPLQQASLGRQQFSVARQLLCSASASI